MLADHRDGVVDLEHVDDARQRPRTLVVHRTQRAAMGGTCLDGGDLHARHLHIDSELGDARHLAGESTRRSGFPMSVNAAGSLSATLAGIGSAPAAFASAHR